MSISQNLLSNSTSLHVQMSEWSCTISIVCKLDKFIVEAIKLTLIPYSKNIGGKKLWETICMYLLLCCNN